MNRAHLLHAGAVGLAVVAALSFSTMPVLADTANTTSSTSAATTSTGVTWTVDAGAMSKSGVMAMAFFPNVITIDAGDTITFEGAGHTVSFPGADGKLPASTSPAAQAPAGGSTYDGTSFTSSGLLIGKPYTLTFTKPGVYPYYCLLHPGMMGVVIVNPAGTPYPMTQAQYNAEGQSEQQADFTAGDQAVSSFQLKAQKNPNGTTTYFAQTDAPEPQTYTFDLSAQNSSTVRGSALIAFSLPPSQSNPETTYSIAVKLAGLTPGQSYTAVLSEGTSGSGVTVPQSQFGTVTVNADGTGTVTGSVNAMALPQGVWTLDIEDATHHIVASGRIDHPSWAYERFLPDTLHIHTGDTVVWTQTGINEVHTVTFLPSGWSDIPNESLMPVPYGGHIYAGTGFYNSGFMVPGATYDLTFIKSGNFAYRCLLHDVMGMLGTVDVTPQPNVLTIALNNSVDNVPSRTVGKTTYVPIWYVMHMLQSQGLHSTWNGSDWKVSSTTPINAHSQAGSSGNIHLYLNNQLLFSGDSQVWSLNGHATTFVPVHQVVGALQSLGFDAAFDGSTLDMTPQAHAGSVPAPTAAQSMGTGGSQSSSASGTSGNAMSGMN